MDSKQITKLVKIGGIVLGLLLVVILGISLIGNAVTPSNLSLDDLTKKVDVKKAKLTKANVNLSNNSLYDELPEIDKYPLIVQGKGDVDIEIFTSPEKGGENHDAWLVDCAKSFNKKSVKLNNGKIISLSVRNVTSGLAADYIISNKYMPDLYTPSSELWGGYIDVMKGHVELYNKCLVGNTAGFLVKKDSGCKSYKDVIDAVIAGKINIGYTNPQVSTAGMNLLINILKDGGADKFSSFQNNIPYVAYDTVQMKNSASNGKLDGMISEYQSYISDDNLKSVYKFIPFGMRHDNPLYIVDKDKKSSDELDAIKEINDYLMNSESQSLANKYGFNENKDYKSSYKVTGVEITNALDVYKQNKDNGKDIIAVFVADCSGSMSGDPMNQLKESLANSMSYINENNYVGLISYSNDVSLDVPINKFDLNQKAYFQGAINNMYASGGTYTYEAVIAGLDAIKTAKKDHPNAKTMMFVLSDGYATGWSLSKVKHAIEQEGVSVYTIGYGSDADKDELTDLANINEATFINADSDDIVYKLKSLFNAQM